MHHDTKQHEEIYYWAHRAKQVFFLVCFSRVQLRVQMSCVLHVEDRADADRPEISHKQCFFPGLDCVWHKSVHDHHSRYAAKEKHQQAQREETSDCDARDLRVELGPR